MRIIIMTEFTENEVKQIIDNLKTKKIPGFDKINNEIVKNLFKLNANLFVILYNKCLELGFFPQSWKISIIKILLNDSDKRKDQLLSTNFFTTSYGQNFGKTFNK